MQKQADAYPAPTNTRGAPYPRISPDGSITFQLSAPGASRVQVQPGGMDNGLGSEPCEMARDAEGVWTDTIGVLSGPPLGDEDDIGMVAAAGEPMDDAAAFNQRVRLLWFGAGTGEPREWGITQRRLKELDKAGIAYTYWETPDVAHEWLTWRRCLSEFITLLFK